jgi:protein-tyrosine phosphatase
MRALVADEGLAARFEIDSAGTGGWHAGELPDHRAREAAARRGIVLDSRARQVRDDDFERFDHILASDRQNLAYLVSRAPKLARAKLALLRSFDPTAGPHAEIPDPYYGGESGFDEVLDMCERACAGLLRSVAGAPDDPKGKGGGGSKR